MSMNEIDIKLLNWLRDDYRSSAGEGSCDEDNNPGAERPSLVVSGTYLTLRLRYIKGCVEYWLFNENNAGKDRRLNNAERKEMESEWFRGKGYTYVRQTMTVAAPKDEGDRIVWEYEYGALADSPAGSGGMGQIIYDKKTDSFRLNDIMPTWIA